MLGKSVVNRRLSHLVGRKSVEIGVVEGCLGRNSSARLEVDHLLEQVYRLVVEVLAHATNVFSGVTLPLGESHFHFLKICYALPGLLSWRAHCPENLKDLPNF